jgi:hypothetical protein
VDKQSIFALFFAIFWGGIMSVTPRWKMFQPVFTHIHIVARFLLSFFLLNVLPIVFFVYEFQKIRNICGDTWVELLASVFPALTIFVFYRLWMAAVEFCPTCFYQNAHARALESEAIRMVEPSIESLNVNHGLGCRWNVVAAMIYAVVGLGVPELLLAIRDSCGCSL